MFNLQKKLFIFLFFSISYLIFISFLWYKRTIYVFDGVCFVLCYFFVVILHLCIVKIFVSWGFMLWLCLLLFILL